MRIAVCIKQVPSSNEVRLDPVTKTIIRDGKHSVINPYDRFAVEQAIQIKEAVGGRVTAISMGIPAAERLLKDAASLGADESLLLSDRAFAGADTLATAYTLSQGVKYMGGFDLILCGKMAIDGDTAQIGPELAENLGIPHVANVSEIIEISDSEITCKHVTDFGVEIVTVQLPALLMVVKDINLPRLASIGSIRRSMDAPFTALDAKALQVDTGRIGLNGSPTQVVRTYVPVRDNVCQMVGGNIQEKIAKILAIVKDGV